MKHLVVISLILCIFLGCNTNPPVSVTELKGFIKVSSNIEGAEIFLDGNNTQKLTPSTIETTPGDHIVKLVKPGYRELEKSVKVIADQTVVAEFELQSDEIKKVILLEDFANVSCDPCVVSNQILHKLAKQFKDKIAIIKFPVNFPSPNDPLYLHAKTYSDVRSSYYKIFAAPTVIVDGQTKPISTDSISIKNAINTALNEETQYSISVDKTISNNKIEINAEIKAFSVDTDIENLVVHTIIIEEEIEFENPPGSNGEKKFYDVMRKMLPGAEGQKLNLQNNTQKLSFSADLNSQWQSDKMRVVVFIQNKQTKKVFQVGISD